MKISLLNEQDTELFGSALWHALPEKCLVFLHGELGAGKTTLTRGVLRAAGHEGAVKSPTYTLVEEYQLDSGKLFHFDLYRLKDPEELEWIGIRDYLEQQSLCFIEWPKQGEGFLPDPDIELRLSVKGEGREVELKVISKSLINNIKLNWKNNNIVI